MYLIVHNQSDMIFTLPPGINIPTGFTTFVGIDRNCINKLSQPYSNCLTGLIPQNQYAPIQILMLLFKTIFFGKSYVLKINNIKNFFCIV